MSELVVGLSYRTAPIALLDRATLDQAACRSLEAALCRGQHVAEAMVLSTCNRLEVYARSTAPLIDYYQAKGLLHEIDGDRPVDEVFAEVKAVLEG